MKLGCIFISAHISFATSAGRLLRKPSQVAAAESRLNVFQKILDLQESYRRLLGVEELDRPTYEVAEGYERFNQKYNLTIGRTSWDAAVREKIEPTTMNAKLLADRNVPGYTIFDQALNAGSRVVPSAFNTEINYPNSGFLSWRPLSSPLSEPSFTGVRMKRLEDVDEARMASLIKKVAMWFGASLARITLLDRRWVYSHWYDNKSSPHRNPRIVFSDEPGFEEYSCPTQLEDGTQVIPKEMKYVISLGIEMDYSAMKTAPAPLSQAGTNMYGYRIIVQTVASLAEFIRGLGYNAIPSSNDTALNIPLAIDAGLGEDARYSGLISPEYGPRLRLAKVITDLPLQPDRPITFHVHDFCNECKKCADRCPAKAIPHGLRTCGTNPNDVNAPTISESIGPLRWMKNGDRCREYWTIVGTNCGICIRVCPWNKPSGPIHAVSKLLAIKGGSQARRILIKLDDLLGYGRQMNPNEWWVS
jgi:reductive dehalogenase